MNVVNTSRPQDVVSVVARLLSELPDPDTALDEIVTYLRMLRDNERHVSEVAGEPRLVSLEALTEAFAAGFHRSIYRSVSMVDLEQLSDVVPVADLRGYLKRQRDKSAIVALKQGASFVYPLFQFDDQHGKVWPHVAFVNQSLLAGRDPWGALAWWTTPNNRWEGRRPIDHVRGHENELRSLVGADADDGF